jgi:hypothetical protein
MELRGIAISPLLVVLSTGMLLARAPEMQRGPAGTVTLRGVVRAPGGRPSTLLLRMTPLDAQASPRGAQPAIATDASGRFTIAAVPPGRYRIAARRSTAPDALIAPFAAVTDIIVGGSDRDDLVLDLKPGGLIEGRVLVDGRLPGPALQGALLIGSEVQPAVDFPPTPRAGIDRSGRFTLPFLMPGAHRLTVQNGVGGPTLTVASQRSGGREAIHGGIQVELGTTTADVEVQVTTRTHTLHGRVGRLSTGGSAGIHVVVFPADRTAWPVTNRVFAARPDGAGGYRFANLPPGEYLVAVAPGLAVDEWLDPDVLAALQPSAVAVVVDGDTELNLPR